MALISSWAIIDGVEGAGLDLAHQVAHLGQGLLEMLLALLQIPAIALQLLDAPGLLLLHLLLAADEIVSAIRCGLHLIEGLGGGVALVGNDGHQLEAEPTDQLYLFFTLEFEAGEQEGVLAPSQWQGDIIADLQPVYRDLDSCHGVGHERHTEPYASQRQG